MIEVVTAYTVKQEAQAQFELTFGPGGAWSDLFARCPGFRGLTVLRDANDPKRYLTIDVWDRESQRKQALADRHAQYADLQTAFAAWIQAETEVGVFKVLGAGGVRPRGKAGTR